MIKSIHSHHLGWNAGNEPALRVAPGDEVELQLLDASGNRVQRGDDASVIPTLKAENANPLTGPIHIDGARPGDLLVVDVLDFAGCGWGWTAIIPGFGLLASDFPDAFLHLSEYDGSGVRFTPEIRLPTRPFAGTIGTCPDSRETLSAIPPHACGGNMDIKDLRAGSTLYFPIQVEGALFSAGDGHAAQGDGEVCGTAVETRLTLRLRFSLIKERSLAAPRARLALPARPGGEALMTMGIGPDLMEACGDAVRYMIDEVRARYGLEERLAYCLCSCAADLRIAQAVNAPHWTVTCRLPTACFR